MQSELAVLYRLTRKLACYCLKESTHVRMPRFWPSKVAKHDYAQMVFLIHFHKKSTNYFSNTLQSCIHKYFWQWNFPILWSYNYTVSKANFKYETEHPVMCLTTIGYVYPQLHSTCYAIYLPITIICAGMCSFCWSIGGVGTSTVTFPSSVQEKEQ